MTTTLTIRTARPDELDALGELTAQVYVVGGYTEEGYTPVLRDAAARAETAELLVALDGDTLLGGVTFAVHGTPFAEIARPGECEVRMLAISPEARGRGAGSALMAACVERARGHGSTRLVLCTQPSMTSAHTIYHRMGFVREPERDWSPAPGIELLAYALDL